MGLLALIVIGGIAGALAGRVFGGVGFGLLGDIIVGIVGAVLGGFLMNLIGQPGFSGFNLWSLFVAFIGAGILVLLLGYARLGTRRVR